MLRKKRTVHDKREPRQQNTPIAVISASLESLKVEQIKELVSDGWLNEEELTQLMPLLSDSAKIKLKGAISNE